jgi:MoxR-like ATPase
MNGRNQVLPEDVQAIAPSVVGHRLRPAANLNSGEGRVLDAAQDLLKNVAIP